MRLKTLSAVAAVAAIGMATFAAGDAEARHGRKAAIIAGGALLGLGLAAAASRSRHYRDDYAYYDDYDHYGGYDYGPPPRRYYREPPRRYYREDYGSYGYYDGPGPYDYPDSYAKEKIKRRNQYSD